MNLLQQWIGLITQPSPGEFSCTVCSIRRLYMWCTDRGSRQVRRALLKMCGFQLVSLIVKEQNPKRRFFSRLNSLLIILYLYSAQCTLFGKAV